MHNIGNINIKGGNPFNRHTTEKLINYFLVTIVKPLRGLFFCSVALLDNSAEKIYSIIISYLGIRTYEKETGWREKSMC